MIAVVVGDGAVVVFAMIAALLLAWGLEAWFASCRRDRDWRGDDRG